MLANYFCIFHYGYRPYQTYMHAVQIRAYWQREADDFLIKNTGSSAHQSTTVCNWSNLVIPNSPHFPCFTNMMISSLLPPSCLSLFPSHFLCIFVLIPALILVNDFPIIGGGFPEMTDVIWYRFWAIHPML